MRMLERWKLRVKRGIARYFTWLGEMAFERERYTDAVRFRRAALDLHCALEDDRAISEVAEALAEAYFVLGQYRPALRYGRLALRTDRRRGDVRAMCFSLALLSGVAKSRGDLPRALNYAERSLGLALVLATPDALATAHGNLGQVLTTLGRYAEALDHLQKTRQLMEDAGLTRVRSYTITHNTLGLLYARLNDDEMALASFSRAQACAVEQNDRLLQSIVLANLGIEHFRHRRWEAVVEACAKALAISVELKDLRGMTTCLQNIGMALTELDRWEEAEDALRQARNTAAAIELRESEWHILAAESRLLHRQGRIDEAKAACEEALAIVTSLGSEPDQVRLQFHLAHLCIAAEQYERAVDLLTAALEAGEDIREDLGEADAFRLSMFDYHAEGYEDLQWVLVKMGRYEAALEAAEAGRGRILARALARVERVPERPPDVAQIRRVAAELETTFVVYSVIESPPDRLDRERDAWFFIWVVPSDPARPIVFHRSKSLRDLASVESVQPSSVPEPVGADVDEPLRDFIDDRSSRAVDADLGSMYDELIAPIEEALPQNEGALVTFIAMGPLLEVPFAAFKGHDGRRLIDRFSVAVTPSIQTLMLNAGRTSAGEGALVVGEPAVPGAIPIPAAAVEAQQVAARCEKTTVLSGETATLEAVIEQMNGKRLLHFATHGEFDPGDSEKAQGALHVTGGLLTARRLASTSLDAELAVLSACNSAQGRVTADGLIGLSRAFMLAGVPSVIATLWEIRDGPSRMLMEHFYARLAEGDDKARALRAAMRRVKELYPWPVFWAGFILIGCAGKTSGLRSPNEPTG